MKTEGLLKLFISFSLLILVGSFGYILIESWSWLDSIYMTFITLSTVGFGEVHPMSDLGRIFTILLILGGVGHMAYFLALIFKFIIDMQFKELFGGEKMIKEISKLKKHTIICGYGQMGKLIAKQMKAHNKPYIIVESDAELAETLKNNERYFIIGNGSDDSVLNDAGISHASELVTTVTTDAENVFITLTAKSLNKNIRVISRVFDDSTIPKLVKAGADKIVSPYTQASLKIAQSIINPAVDDFLEIAGDKGTTEYQIADILVEEKMFCSGKALKDIKLKEQGVLVVGIKRHNGDKVFAPHKDEIIKLGDQLIVIGSDQNFSHLISTMTSEA